MDTTGREKLKTLDSLHVQKGPEREKLEAAKEVKKKASEILHEQSAEAVSGAESSEFVEGKVSEDISEDKAYAPAASGKKTYTADEIEIIRAKLLAALPPQEVMMKQIRRKLYREEKDLTKRMNKLRKKSHTRAFELTIVVAQLRKLREYFSMLAHATYEMIKHLWLKIVHGV